MSKQPTVWGHDAHLALLQAVMAEAPPSPHQWDKILERVAKKGYNYTASAAMYFSPNLFLLSSASVVFRVQHKIRFLCSSPPPLPAFLFNSPTSTRRASALIFSSSPTLIHQSPRQPASSAPQSQDG
jgi:hypothetical protein